MPRPGDGKKVPQKGYITDELNTYALDWLKGRTSRKPFMLYLSHKAVHAEFIPAERHRDKYKNATFVEPKTQDPANVSGAPMWVRNQRNSWHGVDFPYQWEQGPLDIGDYYKRYAETLLAVDEGIGQIIELLKEKGLYENTLMAVMGDNGFAFGEHGLIDKRTAYEESMRVPLVMQLPALIKPGSRVSEVVANIDIAPTFLELAGLKRGDHAVPVLGDELALGLHLLAERIGDVDVEAFQLAVRGQVVEGRVGALGADLQCQFLSLGRARNRHHGGGRERETQ